MTSREFYRDRDRWKPGADHVRSDSDRLSQPEFSNLTAPTITYGTASVTLGGTIAAGSQIPSGESVAATLDGVTQNATIGNDGSFSTAFATSTLAATPPHTPSATPSTPKATSSRQTPPANSP